MPHDLPRHPFLGSTSRLSAQRLRAKAFRRVTRDVYVLAERTPTLHLQVQALQTALPDAVASHGTAAAMLGLPVPRDPRVHLTRPPQAGVSERPGVVTHRAALAETDVVRREGVTLTTAPRTFVDLAARLPLVELVVVGDAAARLVGQEALAAATEAAGGRRGVVRARQALDLVDPGSDSPSETRTRLLLHAAGFSGLRHQVVVRDEYGDWVSRPDLADVEARVAVQYDGLVHLQNGPQQWRSDVDRDERTRAEGWEVVVLTSLDLRRSAGLVAKVRAAYVRAAQRR